MKIDTNEKAAQLYETLVDSGQLHSKRVWCLAYRCAQSGCEVLDVITLPDGVVIVGFPAYKTSPTETATTSSPEGRRNHTRDGDRHWNRFAALMGSVSNPVLACDHLRSVRLPDSALAEDLAARRVLVRVRQDGSRYAVE